MHIEEKRPTDVISAPFESNDSIQQGIDYLYGKILNEAECFNNKGDISMIDKKTMSFRLFDANNTKELSDVLNKSSNSNVGKRDLLISKINAIRQFEHSTWKYESPRRISNYLNYGKSNHASESILEGKKSQEDKAKQSVLSNSRKYLINYQETCGTPYTEYSFAALIIVMAQTTARSLWALIHVIINVASVIQMFAFILRFMLDRIINICKTKNFQQGIIKFMIFTVQLLSVYIWLTFILDFIVLPIVQMTIGIVSKLVIRN